MKMDCWEKWKKNPIIITIQIESQCKDIFFSFFSCLHLGYSSLFFHARCLSFSYKAWTREVNFSFCELWLCFLFSCRCSAQHDRLVGSVAGCPQNITNMQLCRNIWTAWLESTQCVHMNFSSSHAGVICRVFHGPLLLWPEQWRTLMYSCFWFGIFVLQFFFFFFFNTSYLFQ